MYVAQQIGLVNEFHHCDSSLYFDDGRDAELPAAQVQRERRLHAGRGAERDGWSVIAAAEQLRHFAGMGILETGRAASGRRVDEYRREGGFPIEYECPRARTIGRLLQSSNSQAGRANAFASAGSSSRPSTRFAMYSPITGPNLNPSAVPPPATQTFENPGKRSMMKLPDALIS